MTVGYVALLNGNHVRVPLHAGNYRFVYEFLASVHVPCVIANMRTPAKVEQAVNNQLTTRYGGFYVIQLR
jgi:hypothetical protein